MVKTDDNLRAVFRVSPQELYEIVTYGRILRKNRDPILRAACSYLGTNHIILGAGYIEGEGSEKLAKELIPLGRSDHFWLTVKLDQDYKYLAAPSSLIRNPSWYSGTVLIRSWDRDYFPDAPDTAVIVGQIDAHRILKVEAIDTSAIRALASVPPALSWWDSVKRRLR